MQSNFRFSGHNFNSCHEFKTYKYFFSRDSGTNRPESQRMEHGGK